MNVVRSRLALIAVLIIVGLYLLTFHKDLPLNHEAVGLGKGDAHIVHDIIGIILIAGAVVVWRKSRTITAPVPPTSTQK